MTVFLGIRIPLCVVHDSCQILRGNVLLEDLQYQTEDAVRFIHNLYVSGSMVPCPSYLYITGM